MLGPAFCNKRRQKREKKGIVIKSLQFQLCVFFFFFFSGEKESSRYLERREEIREGAKTAESGLRELDSFISLDTDERRMIAILFFSFWRGHGSNQKLTRREGRIPISRDGEEGVEKFFEIRSFRNRSSSSPSPRDFFLFEIFPLFSRGSLFRQRFGSVSIDFETVVPSFFQPVVDRSINRREEKPRKKLTRVTDNRSPWRERSG